MCTCRLQNSPYFCVVNYGHVRLARFAHVRLWCYTATSYLEKVILTKIKIPKLFHSLKILTSFCRSAIVLCGENWECNPLWLQQKLPQGEPQELQVYLINDFGTPVSCIPTPKNSQRLKNKDPVLEDPRMYTIHFICSVRSQKTCTLSRGM